MTFSIFALIIVFFFYLLFFFLTVWRASLLKMLLFLLFHLLNFDCIHFDEEENIFASMSYLNTVTCIICLSHMTIDY
jgi:hypothetical protein